MKEERDGVTAFSTLDDKYIQNSWQKIWVEELI